MQNSESREIVHGAKKGGKAKTITYDVFRLSLSRFNGVVCEYWRRKWFLISFFSVQFLHQRIGKINDGTKQNGGLIPVGIIWVLIFFPNWCTWIIHTKMDSIQILYTQLGLITFTFFIRLSFFPAFYYKLWFQLFPSFICLHFTQFFHSWYNGGLHFPPIIFHILRSALDEIKKM